jgi:hypothetical protein
VKVKDLIQELENCKKDYGDEFLDWEIATEQLDDEDKQFKKETDKTWKWLKDREGWEYIVCGGFWTKFKKEKVFTINVNF